MAPPIMTVWNPLSTINIIDIIGLYRINIIHGGFQNSCLRVAVVTNHDQFMECPFEVASCHELYYFPCITFNISSKYSVGMLAGAALKRVPYSGYISKV